MGEEKLLIIDGQGGGIGRKLILALKAMRPGLAVIALGTNAQATSAMMKAGADSGATGESAICYQCKSARIIAGVSGILHANAMLGEISPKIASAISESEAVKVLLPLERCGLLIAGVGNYSLDELISKTAELIVSEADAITSYGEKSH